MKTLRLAKTNRNVPGALLCPNLKMFKRDVLPTLEEICFTNRIPYKFHKTEYVIKLPVWNSKIWVYHSEDDGYSIKGSNVGWGAINEVNLCTSKAFDAFVSRIRLKHSKLRQCAMSGTPEGFNWFYNRFIAEKRDDTDVFYGDVRENPHIAGDYVDNLLKTYDPQVALQYVEGKFVNINALAALHQFDRKKHATERIERDPTLEVWVSCDFNVDPMSATIYNYVPGSKPKLRGFGEVKIRGADTNDLGRAILRIVGSPRGVVIFPDPAGDARSTKGPNTDIDILKSFGFTDIRYKAKIASVRNCLNAANAFLSRDGLRLDPEKCKHTIIDFEQTSVKQGTGELDKSDPQHTHWVDGFKNMIDYEFPITTGAGGWKKTQIR
jgi:hypothetical protein